MYYTSITGDRCLKTRSLLQESFKSLGDKRVTHLSVKQVTLKTKRSKIKWSEEGEITVRWNS